MKKFACYYIWLLTFFFLLGTVSCKKKPAKPPRDAKVTEEINLAIKEKKYALLFFLNPNGRPSQKQHSILQEIKRQINQKIKFIYISSLNIKNNAFFYQYGVRTLPTIIILDTRGKIATRLSPGIIQKQNLLNRINKLNP